MSVLREIEDHSIEELAQASEWPAIGRYLRLIQESKPGLEPADLFRRRRHRLWLRAALAIYFDSASPLDICMDWSNSASFLIHEAWLASGLARAKFALLALGKLGAQELNMSSDVDLILVRDDSEPADIKAMRIFQTQLSEITSFGFALRVDFTLRPGGASSAAIPSASEFENYYGYHGETWERLAYIRMRAIEGDASLKSYLTTFGRKYSFRKHLDYTVLEDLRALRNKIRREKFETRPEHFHLKLGAGGIRELELFVHALLVMHGGRNPSLQTGSTTAALERLGELGLLPREEADFLIESYWHLRRIENRIQAYEDLQTYDVDFKNPCPALPQGFEDELKARCERVIEIATSFFGAVELEAAAHEFPSETTAQVEWLKAQKFATVSYEDTWPLLLEATAVSKKSERDEVARIQFLKNFVTLLAESKLDRDLGLSLLLDFVKATRAKASFFTLLNHEPKVVENLVRLFSASPYLGTILCSRPELIDEFIYRKQAAPSSDLNTVLDEMAERRLLVELIAANHYLSTRDLANLSINLSDTADQISNLLLERLIAEYGESDISLVAMGKWGGRELGLKSDLDFMFVVPNEPTMLDQKIARRFLARMTEPHRGGSIYAVDMRLRPSGHAGPMLVSQSALNEYTSVKAAAWERQAYLRARPLDSIVSLKTGIKFESPAKLASQKGLSTEDLQELIMIRGKLFHPAMPGEIDLKLNHGGLADIEFCVQIALLAQRAWTLDTSTAAMIQYMESIDNQWKKAGSFVREMYLFLREVEQLYQLTTSQSGSKIRVKSDEFKRLALLYDCSASELEGKIRLVLTQVQDELEILRIRG